MRVIFCGDTLEIKEEMVTKGGVKYWRLKCETHILVHIIEWDLFACKCCGRWIKLSIAVDQYGFFMIDYGCCENDIVGYPCEFYNSNRCDSCEYSSSKLRGIRRRIFISISKLILVLLDCGVNVSVRPREIETRRALSIIARRCLGVLFFVGRSGWIHARTMDRRLLWKPYHRYLLFRRRIGRLYRFAKSFPPVGKIIYSCGSKTFIHSNRQIYAGKVIKKLKLAFGVDELKR